MSVVTGVFETSQGPQVALASGVDAEAKNETVIVFSEVSEGELVKGQFAILHKVPNGHEPGQFHS